jgi:hypothetical protein
MMEYKVTTSIPYEGDCSFNTFSLQEVKDYLKANANRLDDITVEVIASTLDVYELTRQAITRG